MDYRQLETNKRKTERMDLEDTGRTRSYTELRSNLFGPLIQNGNTLSMTLQGFGGGRHGSSLFSSSDEWSSRIAQQLYSHTFSTFLLFRNSTYSKRFSAFILSNLPQPLESSLRVLGKRQMDLSALLALESSETCCTDVWSFCCTDLPHLTPDQLLLGQTYRLRERQRKLTVWRDVRQLSKSAFPSWDLISCWQKRLHNWLFPTFC